MKMYNILLSVLLLSCNTQKTKTQNNEAQQETQKSSTKVAKILHKPIPCNDGISIGRDCLQGFYDTQGHTVFHNGIQGFKYEPGYEYVLEITETKLDIVPADHSGVVYTLVKEVSKTKRIDEVYKKWNLIQFKNYTPEQLKNFNASINVAILGSSAYMGCNSLGISTDFKADGTCEIIVTTSTIMACVNLDGNQNMPLEIDFNKYITEYKNYKIVDNTLILRNEKGDEIVFIKTH